MWSSHRLHSMYYVYILTNRKHGTLYIASPVNWRAASLSIAVDGV
jgi:hypothetical protein